MTNTQATDKQINFLKTLLAEREGVEAAEEWRTGLNVAATQGELTKAYASRAITELLSIPKPKAEKVTEYVTVAEGRYAVTLPAEDKLRFFRVDTPTEGKWAGYVFVKEQASDDHYPVKGARRFQVLKAIAADPDALARYGQELGHCGVCGKALTDDESRAIGIGPVCRNK